MMKEERSSDVLVIPRQPVVAVSPGAAYLSPAMGVHTPSPFSFSVTSTRWSTSSRPSIDIVNLFLRAMVMLFSFGSSLALAAAKPKKDKQGFQHHPVFVYSFVITTSTFIYSAYQLFKCICDITYKGYLISDKTSDYTSFVLDQIGCYLLVSCSSVMVYQELEGNTPVDETTIVSVCMTVVALVTSIVCAIMSGYKLSKRVMW